MSVSSRAKETRIEAASSLCSLGSQRRTHPFLQANEKEQKQAECTHVQTHTPTDHTDARAMHQLYPKAVSRSTLRSLPLSFFLCL